MFWYSRERVARSARQSPVPLLGDDAIDGRARTSLDHVPEYNEPDAWTPARQALRYAERAAGIVQESGRSTVLAPFISLSPVLTMVRDCACACSIGHEQRARDHQRGSQCALRGRGSLWPASSLPSSVEQRFIEFHPQAQEHAPVGLRVSGEIGLAKAAEVVARHPRRASPCSRLPRRNLSGARAALPVMAKACTPASQRQVPHGATRRPGPSSSTTVR